MKKELAEVGNFTQHLTQIGIGLDEFQRFVHGDAQQGAKQWHQQLDIPLPDIGIGLEQVTKELVEQVIPNGASMSHPGFSSYITTGGTTASTIASAAASIASPQRYSLTAFNFIEEQSLKWLAQMLSLDNMLGVYSSGGSVANLVALGAARQSAFEAIGVDPAAQGMNRSGSIYASGECHHTIQRSAGVLGLGRNCVKAVKCDTKGRVDVEDLEELIKSDIAAGLLPIAVVANAGTTNTCAIDPLLAMGQIAKRYAIWFHVDGAYGLPGILDDRISHLYAGLSMADSVIVDPHKWLGAAVGVAATFVRDRDLLQRAFTQEPADYLEGSIEQNSTELNTAELGAAHQEKDIHTPLIAHSMDSFGIPYFDYGVELSSPCRGIVVWALLKEIGVQGIRERVIRHNDMSRYIAKIATDHPQLELLDEPTLSICCFRYVDDSVIDLNSFNQTLHRRLVRENNYMPSTTKVHGQLAIRPCYIGARHELHQVDGLICEVLKLGLEMTKSGVKF